jgi:hypothetical protein
MPVFYGLMLLVYAVTLFVSATLLFLLQPMVGKMILPLLGGTPAVWNTCMVFFQAMLLLGYTYAHVTTAWLGVRLQAIFHIILLAIPAIVLPIVVNRELAPQGEANPVFGVLLLLLVTAGLPFFVVATSAPLLQKWFASTGHPAAGDPYFLYGASNLGSMLALLSYPLVLEPNKTLPGQSWLWALGYFLLAMLTCGSALFLWLAPKRSVYAADGLAKKKELVSTTPNPKTAEPAPSVARRLRWVALAFVPSSLMLGVTTFVTTDLAAVPFLWVVPLGLYLLSFILVFSRLPAVIHWIMVGLLPLAVLALVYMMLADTKTVIWRQILLHLIALFVVAMVCHGELARDRPAPKYLTGFYLLMSAGGVLGGIFNTLVAPLIFDSVKEYEVALVGACLLMPRLGSRERSTPSLIYNLVLAWGIGTVGAYLVTLVIRDRKLHLRDLMAALTTPGTLICLAAIGVLLTAYLLWDKRDALNRVFDVVLPVLLALFTFGLLWGLAIARWKFPLLNQWLEFDTQTTVRGQAATHHWDLTKYVMFGLPGALCLCFFFRPIQFGLGVAALLLVGGLYGAQNQNTGLIRQVRSFYSIMRIDRSVEETDPSLDESAVREYHLLNHGNITHGVQRIYDWPALGAEIFAPLAACTPADAALSSLIRYQIWTEKHYPVAYFHPSTPYGQMFLSFTGEYRKKNIAIIGLGTGGLAGYAYPGQKWRYFELDPAVEKIARDTRYFTYLADCDRRGVDLKVILGDARVQLRKLKLEKPEDKFDVIVFDAFTSDAIPIHLVTYDAFKDYRDKLADDGIVVFHISNRYVDLKPVIARLQQEAGWAGLIQEDFALDGDPEHYATTVIILARRREAFGKLAQDERWETLRGDPQFPLWTDDYSDLLGVFKWQDK